MLLRDEDSDDAGVGQCFDDRHSACFQLPLRRRQHPVIRSADMQARKTEMPALLEEAAKAMGINSCFLTPADMQALRAVSIMHHRGAEHPVQRCEFGRACTPKDKSEFMNSCSGQSVQI